MKARGGLLAAVLLGCQAAAPGTLAAQDGFTVRVGHSYSSAQAIGQPATFSAVRSRAQPWLTQLDAGVLATGPWFPSLLHEAEVGLRFSGGSARPRSQRVHGAMIRGFRAIESARMVVALTGEYEADGGFDVAKGVIGAEVSPYGFGSIGLGRWSSGADKRGAYWRPWAGVGYGTVFDTDQAASTVEQDGFWRAYLRLVAAWRPGAIELDLEATGRWLENPPTRPGFMKASVSVPVGSGVSLTATAEAGSRPPRFERTGQLSAGMGFRLNQR